MSVPDADTLIRLAEILEVYVSELLGTKIENENVASDVAEQLSSNWQSRTAAHVVSGKLLPLY